MSHPIQFGRQPAFAPYQPGFQHLSSHGRLPATPPSPTPPQADFQRDVLKLTLPAPPEPLLNDKLVLFPKTQSS